MGFKGPEPVTLVARSLPCDAQDKGIEGVCVGQFLIDRSEPSEV
jgi:hypothetical protein